MQIEIKGRNVAVTDDLRDHAERRLAKVSRQVSEFARLEMEISKEPNPRRIGSCQVAEATLYLKGATLRVSEASHDMHHSLNLVVDELSRQVKRHRDKRRRRREAHAQSPRAAIARSAPGGVSATA